MNLRFRFMLSATLALICSAAPGEERVEDSMVTLLVSAKIAGSCGMLSQLAQFQKSTKMPGGDEFLTRFLNTESARLGFSPDQYLDNCGKAQKTYQDFYEAAKNVR